MACNLWTTLLLLQTAWEKAYILGGYPGPGGVEILAGKAKAILALVVSLSVVSAVSAFVVFTARVDVPVQEPLEVESVSGSIGFQEVECTMDGSSVTCNVEAFAGEFGSLALTVANRASVPVVATVTATAEGDDDISEFVTLTPATPGAFVLQGNAMVVEDPQEASNEVIRVDTSTGVGVAFTSLNVPIQALDGRVSLNFFLEDRDCGGGSPRIQLAIDATGDGFPDGNAFGYVGPTGTFAGCEQNVWEFQDLQDGERRWEPNGPLAQVIGSASAICGSFVCTWDEFASHLQANFPGHRVLTGSLVDDSFWLESAAGVAYYDNVQIGASLWEDGSDVAGPGMSLELPVIPTRLALPRAFVFGIEVSSSAPAPLSFTVTLSLDR